MARKKRRGGSKRGRGRSKRPVYLRNPGEELMIVNPPRSRARRAVSRARGFLGSSGIGGAIKSQIPMLAGALSAKLAQKKFGDKTAEDGNWTWKDYLAGAIGAFVVSQGSKWIFKASPATSQKMLEGGLLILGFKLITQELVPMSDTAKGWLGADEGEGSWDGYGADEGEGSWDGYGEDEMEGYDLGDLYEAPDGLTYVFDGQGWQPWDSSNRAAPAADGFGGELVRPGPALGGFGGELVRPGATLGADAYADKWGTNW